MTSQSGLPAFDVNEIADLFVDDHGYVRDRRGVRVTLERVSAETVIFDTRGLFAPGSLIWADGVRGCDGLQLNFWDPGKIPLRTEQHRGEGREWTESELQVLQAAEFMVVRVRDELRVEFAALLAALEARAAVEARSWRSRLRRLLVRS